MRLIHTSLFAAIAALGLAACNQQPAAPQAETPPAAPADGATTEPAATPAPAAAPAADVSASAELAPTQGNETKGSVTFKVVDGKVHVTGQISGLKPGSEHGFHIHEKADCTAPDGSSAGGHFNPSAMPHGPQGGARHAGDMPNLRADAQGRVDTTLMVGGVTAGGGAANDIVGRSLLVLGATPGAISARVACGVITASQ